MMKMMNIEEIIVKPTRAEVEIIKQLRSNPYVNIGPNPKIRRTASRICFGVEHGDYNGTELFGAAIGVESENKNEISGFIWFMYSPNAEGKIKILSLNYPDQIADFKLGHFISPSIVQNDKDFPWIKFPMGVDYVLRKRGISLTKGINGVLIGKIPEGGLSRSASLTLNLMLSLLEVNNINNVDPFDIIDWAQAVENEYVGSPCGKLDQAMILFGRKDKGSLYSPRKRTLKYIELPPEAPEVQIVVLDTGTKRHGLQSSDYVVRQKECMEIVERFGEKYGFSCLAEVTPQIYQNLKRELDDPILKARLQYIFEANQRLYRIIRFWKEGNMEEVGKLINEDGIGLRDLYDISGPQLEAMVTLARADKDVLGARMAGGGRFGASFALRRATPINSLKEIIDRGYSRSYPDFRYAIHVCKFVDGVVKLDLG